MKKNISTTAKEEEADPSHGKPDISSAGSGSGGERTEVIYGPEETTRRILDNLYSAKNVVYACADSKAPSVNIEVEPIRNCWQELSRRGIKIRYITEITAENINYCKQMMNFCELRHVDGIKGNFGVIDGREYLGVAILQEAAPLPQVIYSNVRGVVEQQQYLLETLWKRAMPAEQKIWEIEEGIEPVETKIVEDIREIRQKVSHTHNASSELSVCSVVGGMQLAFAHFIEDYKMMLDKQAKGKHKGIRWVTTIKNKEDIGLVKIFLSMGVQVKHVDNLIPVNFAITEKTFNATIEEMKGGKMLESLLTSNEPLYVKHFRLIFDELWKKGIDAPQKIKDIEAGIEPSQIEVIHSPSLTLQTYKNLIQEAKQEILIIFPTINAIRRQEKAGIIELLKLKATNATTPSDSSVDKGRVDDNYVNKKLLKIRILMPYDINATLPFAEGLKRQFPNTIDIRFTEQSLSSLSPSETTTTTKTTIAAEAATLCTPLATFFVVDRSASLTIEIKADSKVTFDDESIGLSVFSNSKAGVLSTVSIFENLWMQAELYDQIKYANEQLQIRDKIQKEFINIAAHELRTPVQPILGRAEILKWEIESGNYDLNTLNEALDMIIRNSQRLQRLTNDLLTVSKIERNTLRLNKEDFDLSVLVENAIKDAENHLKIITKEEGITIVFLQPKEKIFVNADRDKIAQVIHNLMSNAVKFTEKGAISITLEKGNDNTSSNGNGGGSSSSNSQVLFRIKDTGTGIEPSLFPRLFQIFATDTIATSLNQSGSGVGLYVSKSIIEAHGGRMWAENNSDSKGATFTFVLPT